jgi:hypothetical protein
LSDHYDLLTTGDMAGSGWISLTTPGFIEEGSFTVSRACLVTVLGVQIKETSAV